LLRRIARTCGEADAVALTRELVAFQTVAAIAPPERNPAFAAMVSWLDARARGSGLELRVCGAHDAYEVRLAGRSSERALLFVAHGDVVPVNDPPAFVEAGAPASGWASPPFRAEIRDGKLFGRGTEDDKGPLAAALLAMAAASEARLVPDGDVVLAIGTAEEHDWDPMKRYVATAPRARHVVSIDADFPVVSAQSGFVAWGVRARAEHRPCGRRPVVRALSGGLFLTQVPELAEMDLEACREPPEALAARARDAARTVEASANATWTGSAFRVEVAIPDGRPRVVRVTARGKAAHASVPERASNALWPLALAARKLDVAEGGARTVLDVVADDFAGDHRGARLGLAQHDPFMGPLVVAPTKLRMQQGWVTLEVNMRRPRGGTVEQFGAALVRALEGMRARHGPSLEAVAGGFVGAPHVVDPASPLPRTLVEIFEQATGQRAEPRSARGGTYARLFEGGVDFGPALPGKAYTGHGADEHIEVGVLGALVRMYLEVILRLCVDATGQGATPGGGRPHGR
jgi:predicted dipeptidase